MIVDWLIDSNRPMHISPSVSNGSVTDGSAVILSQFAKTSDKPGDRQAVHPLLRIRTDNIPSAQMRDRQRRAVPSDHEFDNWIYLDRQLAPGEQYYWYP